MVREGINKSIACGYRMVVWNTVEAFGKSWDVAPVTVYILMFTGYIALAIIV